MNSDSKHALLQITTGVVTAYLANNHIRGADLPALIAGVHSAFSVIRDPPGPGQIQPESVGAVSIRKSLARPEHIISMIDGRPYQLLKRHLRTHGLTPEAYRTRYNLPADYPMVARAYSERRREIMTERRRTAGRPA